jgi:hypothetical protein
MLVWGGVSQQAKASQDCMQHMGLFGIAPAVQHAYCDALSDSHAMAQAHLLLSLPLLHLTSAYFAPLFSH